MLYELSLQIFEQLLKIFSFCMYGIIILIIIMSMPNSPIEIKVNKSPVTYVEHPCDISLIIDTIHNKVITKKETLIVKIDGDDALNEICSKLKNSGYIVTKKFDNNKENKYKIIMDEKNNNIQISYAKLET